MWFEPAPKLSGDYKLQSLSAKPGILTKATLARGGLPATLLEIKRPRTFMNKSHRLKTYREDVQWFYDRHPGAYLLWTFLFAFTFFSLFDCVWPSDSTPPYAIHVGKLALKAAFVASGLAVLRHWRKARRASLDTPRQTRTW